jgi:hypothetical protein
MAYIGQAPSSTLLSTFSETFSGDGSTLQFTLARSVGRASDLEVFIGNTQQMPTAAYSASGSALLFVSAPSSGTNNITVIYRAGALQTLQVNAAAFDGGSAAAPTVNATAASTTGIYWPSATDLGLTANGSLRVRINSTAASTSTSTGAAVISGGLGMSGNAYVGGNVRITSGTAASSNSTGALVVTGGVGISGAAYIGDDLTVAGDFTVNGTFTTTASDSLSITDPFVFLASDNAGDSLDQGFVGKYVDGGSTTRYHGIFRDITDSQYKLFTNLTALPTTVVDTANASFAYANLVVNSIGTDFLAYATDTGGIKSTANILPNANATFNLGSTSLRWNTLYGLATSAQYADLAENYLADREYEPGTVMVFGGKREITASDADMDTRVAGVVSTNPAHLMNGGLEGPCVTALALTGRVPTKVYGPVRKGDLMVCTDDGHARSELEPLVGSVIGKALENFDGDEGVIEVVVGRV